MAHNHTAETTDDEAQTDESTYEYPETHARTDGERVEQIKNNCEHEHTEWLVDEYADIVDDQAASDGLRGGDMRMLAAALDALAVVNEKTIDISLATTDIDDGIATSHTHPRILQEFAINESRDDIVVNTVVAEVAQRIHNVAALNARGQDHRGSWWTLMPIDGD